MLDNIILKRIDPCIIVTVLSDRFIYRNQEIGFYQQNINNVNGQLIIKAYITKKNAMFQSYMQ